MNSTDHKWTLLTTNEQYWPQMNSTDHKWTALTHTWTVLTHKWSVLTTNEQHWPTNEQYWPTNDQYWPQMNSTDPQMNSTDPQMSSTDHKWTALLKDFKIRELICTNMSIKIDTVNTNTQYLLYALYSDNTNSPCFIYRKCLLS